ncbi:hypothetical protein C1646_662405 [Rhizophagus diaphanus]|nr:hypothetical protein C1646_662405 [Rhizophagus diaphanus] [Rhizophagus sp. MUCL 43196]
MSKDIVHMTEEKVFRNFLERKNSFLLCNKEDNSREWEEKKLKLEAVVVDKARLVKLQEEEINKLKKKIKKLKIDVTERERIILQENQENRELACSEKARGKRGKFKDALTNPKLSTTLAVSMVPKSNKKIKAYNRLNNDFSSRINMISESSVESETNLKKSKIEEPEEDKLNESKKRLVKHQATRADYDSE